MKEVEKQSAIICPKAIITAKVNRLTHRTIDLKAEVTVFTAKEGILKG